MDLNKWLIPALIALVMTLGTALVLLREADTKQVLADMREVNKQFAAQVERMKTLELAQVESQRTAQALAMLVGDSRRILDRLEQIQVAMNERYENRYKSVLDIFEDLKTRIVMVVRQLNRALSGKEQVLDEYSK